MRWRSSQAVAKCAWVLTCLLLLGGCATGSISNERADLEKIQHVIVIYAENRSFDNLYGLFPGANGVANAKRENTIQVDRDGRPLPVLPAVWKGKHPDPAFPTNLPNAPFRIDAPPINMPLSVRTRDLVHAYYQNIEQIDGGKMDKFAAISDAGGLVMGHYDGSALPLWRWAKEYTLADNFFMAAFGGSYLNHFWLVCACTPRYENAAASLRAALDESGHLKLRRESPASALEGAPVFVNPGLVTPDGYSVNTSEPPYQPSLIPPAPNGDARFADSTRDPLPPQTMKTIGDTLSAKGVSWVWYAGAWNDALKDGMQPASAKRTVIRYREAGGANYITHHAPFNYFVRFAPGTADREQHLKDYVDFIEAIDAGTLPNVAFYKPQGSLNEHPGYADVLSGDQHIADVLARIKASALWSTSAIIITYDDNGGLWDHVPPPKGDRWGPGNRIPTIIVSPFAKRGFIDHTQYDTTSIIKFITRRFHLEPLPGVRASMGDLSAAFDFEARP